MSNTYRRSKSEYRDQNSNYVALVTDPKAKVPRKIKNKRSNNKNKSWRQDDY